MMKNKKLFLILVFTLFLSGCFNEESEKLKIREIINPFYETFLFEDIVNTMIYFDQNSPSYYDTYHFFLENFNDYDLLYEAIGISFTSVEKDLIHAKVKLSITGVGEDGAKINKDVIHILIFKMDSLGDWKIKSLNEVSLK